MMKLGLDQIHPEWFNPDQSYFDKIISKLSQHFFEIKISTDTKENLVFSMEYSNLSYFLKRTELAPISYQALHSIANIMGDLRKSQISNRD